MNKVKKLPKGWLRRAIFDVAPIKGKLVDPKLDKYSKLILVAPNHIEQKSGQIIARETAIEQTAISGKFLVQENEVIYSKIRPYLMKTAIAPEKCLCSADMYPLRCKDEIEPKYLHSILLSERFTYYANSCSTRTGIPKLNRDDMGGYILTFPPLPEQKAIADLLSTWDEVIKKTERLIQAKENRFKWLLNGLIYIPVTKNKWEQLRAKSLFKQRKESNRPDLPLLSITNDEGVIPREDTNRKDTSNKDKSKYLRICPGDIGYNTMRMWQGVSALSSLEGIVSPAYTICIFGEKLDPQFVAYLFKMPFMIHRFYRNSQGLTSDTWNLKFRHFCEVRIPMPSLEEQTQIADMLSFAHYEIDLLKQLAEKYKTQKRGLMQKMLIGEWRVKPEVVKQYMEVSCG